MIYTIERWIWRLYNYLLKYIAIILPSRFKRFISNNFEVNMMRFYPDRIFLRKILKYQPNNAKVLWIGCRRYNMHEFKLLAGKNCEVTVTDIDEYVSRFSLSNSFVVDDISKYNLKFDKSFDVIVFNGVLGDGLNDANAQLCAIENLRKYIRTNGIVIVGLNSAGHQCYSPSAEQILLKHKAVLLAEIRPARHKFFILSE